MAEYRELTNIKWTSEKAVSIDVPSRATFKPERLFFPRSVLREVNGSLYAPAWLIERKLTEFSGRLEIEHGLGATIEVPDEPRLGAVSASSIIDFFDAASENLAYPKVVLGDVKLARSGPRAKIPYAVNVTDLGRYPDNKWFGRVERDGNWLPTRNTPAEVYETVKEFAADPAGFAARIGKLHGACCFCRRELTDARSTETGYGPVCALKYSLPWGSSKEEK